MFIYLAIFLLLLVGSFFSRNLQKYYLVFSFLILFFLSAFRDITVGTDTAAYKYLFTKVQSGEILQRQEIGWHYFNAIIAYFDGHFQWILVFSTLLVLAPVFMVVKRHSLNPMLSIFLFYSLYIYLQSFNIMRQIIALSITFYSFKFLIEDKKYIYYIIGVLIASLFHITALLCLPLIFARKIPDKKLIAVILILTSLVVGVLLSSFLLPIAADLLGYSHYLTQFESETETGMFLMLSNLVAIFFVISSSKSNAFLQVFIIYIIFYNIVARVPFASRLVSYFSIFQLLFYPYYIYNNKLKHRHVSLLIVVLYATIVFIRNFGAGDVIPYKNILF